HLARNEGEHLLEIEGRVDRLDGFRQELQVSPRLVHRPSYSLHVNKYEWLLFLHMTGAFLFLGAAVVALVFTIAALRRERPSEIALLLRLTARTTPAFGVGGVLLIVFGLWLVDDAGYGYGDGWIVAALVLFVLSNVFGAVGGERGKPGM